MRRPTPAVAAALLGILLLAGCDRHAAALARPAGENVERVRVATIDVVLSAGYAILEAPECELADGAVTCHGSTTDRLAIEATSPRSDRQDVRVTVDGTEIYSGAVRAVLEDAARAS